MPKRDAVDLRPYLDAWRARHGANAGLGQHDARLPLQLPLVQPRGVRIELPPAVAQARGHEVALVVERYNPDSLWFVDDVFTINHRWLEELTNELERRSLRVPYECITRADCLDERAVGLLRRSGCFRVWIGAESGSQKVLDAMDRRVTVERVRDMIQLSKKHGIQTGTFIMIGYPGETEADIEATIEHLKRSDPDQFTITVAYPIKGTPYYEEIRDDIVDERPWEATTDRSLQLRRPHSDLYYKLAVARVVSEVRSFQLERSTRASSMDVARHKVKAVLARAGMRMEPMLAALDSNARRVVERTVERTLNLNG